MLVFGTAMVDFLARDASPDGLALLAALRAVDPMILELDCARAIEQLRAAGVPRPDWFDTVGTAGIRVRLGGDGLIR